MQLQGLAQQGSRPRCRSGPACCPAPRKPLKSGCRLLPCRARSQPRGCAVAPGNGHGWSSYHVAAAPQLTSRRTVVCSAAAAPASSLDVPEAIAWLQQYLPFSVLDQEALTQLVKLMSQQEAEAGQLLQGVGQQPELMLVVRNGSVRISNAVTGGVTTDAGPGALINLAELLLPNPAASTTRITALTPCTLWTVPRAAIQELASRRPELVLELGLIMSRAMSDQLQDLSATLAAAERRKRALLPYLVVAPDRGVIGNSKYAERLRKAVVLAARDPGRGPALIFGEPGLGKANLAALIHFGGPCRDKPMVQIDCALADPQLVDLFGRGSKEGLLHWVQDGTVLLNNVHKLPPYLFPQIVQLMRDNIYQPAPAVLPTGSLDMPAPLARSSARILMTAEVHVPELEAACTVIKVPPLRVRPADILDMEKYLLRMISRQRGEALSLTPEAERQLLSYSYPGNFKELQSLVERASVQAINNPAAQAAEAATATSTTSSSSTTAAAAPMGAIQRTDSGTLQLDKDVFWFAAQSKDRFRWSMLPSLPLLRDLLRSDLFPELLNHKVVKPVFAVVVALLFLGPQDRQHNFCLNFFWDYWWPGIFLVYPFLGRIWCSFCPFMVYGEVVQRWRMATGAPLLRWPRDALERWGGWFLWSLFAAILVWEEVWDLPNSAALSSCLLLLITAGAMVGSYFYERRVWCRYLCPVGGMNGLFAKLSMTELRARQGVCSGTCSTYTCYKGGPAIPPEGQETLGCPVYSHPAQLNDNRNCVLCMTCLKACPHRSIEIRLRPPGVDLWTGHTATWYEVFLLYMLLGAVYLHRLPFLEQQLGVDPALLEHKLPHIAASIAIMAVPGLLAWAADGAMRLLTPAITRQPAKPAGPTLALAGAGVSGPAAETSEAEPTSSKRRRSRPATTSSSAAAAASGPTPAAAAAAARDAALDITPPPFLQLSYAYLPLVWGATLAHYTQALTEEAGTILPVTAATFGLDGSGLPVLVADHAVTSFLQGGLLLGSAGLSLLLVRKLGGRRWRVLAPQCVAVGVLTAELWHLIVR